MEHQTAMLITCRQQNRRLATVRMQSRAEGVKVRIEDSLLCLLSPALALASPSQEKDHVLSKVRESLHLPVLSADEIEALKAAKSGKAPSGGGGGAKAGDGGAGGAWTGSQGEDYTKDMEMQEILSKSG